MNNRAISFILPCLNEHATAAATTSAIRTRYPDSEIIVVDDGSDPAITLPEDVKVIRHPYRIGNGAAIKTGARNASGDTLVFMDADGQHDPGDIARLLEPMDHGFDMVVGARNAAMHASGARRWANAFFNRLATLMTGFQVQDLTSGFRAASAKTFRNFLYLLPNGFSYPSTSTMAFFRCGYSVAYVPIHATRREGRSKIKLLRDGIKFFIIILRIGALFSPMRLFLPMAVLLFGLGTGWHIFTYITANRFTNMGAVLYLSALLTFLFGIVSEQISALHYRYSEERRRSHDAPGRDRDGHTS